MNLTIIHPAGQKIYDIEWLEVETTTGNYIIQEDHVPSIFILVQHTAVVQSIRGKRELIKLNDGMLHVERKQITLVTSTSL